MFFLIAYEYVIRMLCWENFLHFEIDCKYNHVTNIVVVELWLLLGCMSGHVKRKVGTTVIQSLESGWWVGMVSILIVDGSGDSKWGHHLV